MAEAARDNNHVPISQFLSNADGTTPLAPYVDSSTNRLLVSATTDFGQTEGEARQAGDAGVYVLGIRQDAQADLGDDGDFVGLSVNASGELRTTTGAGTQYTEDVATANPIVGTATMMERDDVLATLTLIEGDWASLRCSAEGALWVQDFNSDAQLTAQQAIQAAVEGTLTVSGAVTVSGVATAANQTTIIGHVDGIEGLLTTIDADTGAILADTNAIKTAVEIIDNAISGSEMQVDVVAPLPAGTNNIGDVDVLTLPSPISGPGNPTIDSYTQVAINLAAAANQVLVSSAASKQIWVYAVAFTVNAAGTVSFQDEDDVALSGIMNFAASGGMTIGPSGNFAMPIWKLGTDKDLEVDVVTSEIDGWLTYALVSV